MVVALAVLVELLLGAEADFTDVAAEPPLVHLVRLGVRRQLVAVDEVALVTDGADETVRVPEREEMGGARLVSGTGTRGYFCSE